MLNFANLEKKRVVFFSDDLNELVLYFQSNEDATLIVDFDDYFKFRTQKDFFKEIVKIPFKKILFIGNGGYNYDLNGFLKNNNLLELDDSYSEIAYDFSGFPNLEILRYLYQKGSCNYSSMTKLKELSLWEYSKKNIDEFLDLHNLEELRFVQSKIDNLNGINHFKKMRSVFLIANKNLMFDSNTQPNENVKELYIDSCKKIDINIIPRLFPSLEKLTLMKNGEIKELRYLLDNLKYLKELNLMGTKILENDNRYWKNYNNINAISFLDQSNLILKSDEFK